MRVSGAILSVAAAAAWLLPVVAAEPSYHYHSYDRRNVRPLTREEDEEEYSPYGQPLREDPKKHAQLQPALHPSLNRRDHVHLKRAPAAQLFYADGIFRGDEDQLVAKLDAVFFSDTVVLDHSAHVRSVSCSPEQMKIQLTSATALQEARQNWTGGFDDHHHMVFVSSAKDCHSEHPGQFGFFNATAITFDKSARTATAKGKQISMIDAVYEYNIEWGAWEVDRAEAVVVEPELKARAAKTTTSKKSTSTKKTTSTKKPTSTKKVSTSTKKTSTTTKKTSTTTKKASTTTKKTSTAAAAAKKTSSTSTKKASSTSTKKTSTSSTARATSTTANRAAAAVVTSSTKAAPEPMNSMKPPPFVGTCAVPPKPLPSNYEHFKRLDCDNDFDKNVDDYLSYLKETRNPQAVRDFLPNVPDFSLSEYLEETGDINRRDLDRRFLSWVYNNVIKPAAKAVYNAAKEAVKAVVFVAKELTKAAQGALNAIRDAAAALLPSFSPSISFNIPISMAAPSWMLEESPWGEAYKVYEYQKGGGELNYGINAASLAKMMGADQLLTFEIKGVKQLPQPGIQFYCVGCSVKGSMKTTGSATYTLLVGFTKLNLRFEGKLDALLQLGVNAYAEWEKEIFKKRLFDIGVEGFYIPGIIIVGPMITLDIDAKLNVEALGQLLAGARLTWPRIGANINFFDYDKSTGYGYIPDVKPVFNVSGEVSATLSMGLPIAVAVGIDILEGKYHKSVALIDRPAIQAKATYKTDFSAGGTNKRDLIRRDDDDDDDEMECPGGIHFEAGLVNELEFNVLDQYKWEISNWDGYKFIEGCIGDNGVAMVREQQPPKPVGKTRGGCTLMSDLIQNPGFDDLTDDKSDAWFYNVQPYPFTDSRAIKVNIFTDSKATSPPRTIGFWIEQGDTAVTYTANIFQTVTACTYSPYDITFQARLIASDGACKVKSAYAKSSNSVLDVVVPVDEQIYPVTSGKDYMSEYGPYTVSFLGQNNANSVSVNFGLTVECSYASHFDLRIDDLLVQPNPSALTRRDLLTLDQGVYARDDNETFEIPDLSKAHRITVFKPEDEAESSSVRPSNSTATISKRAPQLPTLPTGNALPTIPAVNSAPVIPSQPTTALPAVDPKNSAPALEPNNKAPGLDFKPTTILGTPPPGADPTALARQAGPADYDFPPWSKLMESATLGVIGAAPTGSAEPFTGWSKLADLTGRVQLSSHDDGNLYLAPNGGSSGVPEPGTSFFSEESVVIMDEGQRMFHYHPDTIGKYGVSRIRVSTIGDAPISSRMLTLIPFATEAGPAYGAIDTEGNVFVLAWCSAPKWPGSKVFLAQDYENGLPTLLSGEVQWIVTGNNVTQCNPLLLTSGAKPLVDLPEEDGE